jgi:hypothetical protein
VLEQSQALGDLQSPQSKKRRVVRVHPGRDMKAGLNRLSKALEAAETSCNQGTGHIGGSVIHQ